MIWNFTRLAEIFCSSRIKSALKMGGWRVWPLVENMLHTLTKSYFLFSFFPPQPATQSCVSAAHPTIFILKGFVKNTNKGRQCRWFYLILIVQQAGPPSMITSNCSLAIKIDRHYWSRNKIPSAKRSSLFSNPRAFDKVALNVKFKWSRKCSKHPDCG